MWKIEIELPDTVTVTAGDASEEFDWSKIDEDKLAAFVATAAITGVAKSGNDSASGASAYAKKHDMDIEDARAELIGKWVQKRYDTGQMDRAAGDGMNEVEKEAVRMCRRAVKEADEKWYKSADETEKWARMVEHFDAQSDKAKDALMRTAKARVDRRKEEAAQKAADIAELKELGIEL